MNNLTAAEIQATYNALWDFTTVLRERDDINSVTMLEAGETALAKFEALL